MEIDTSTYTYNTPDASQISSRSETMGTADFLKMLVAQLTSQDPMNPLDSQDFATQLATFSSLQELTSMNDSLDLALQSNLLLSESFNNTMSSFLVGKTVKAQSDDIDLNDSGTSTINYQLGGAATSVTVEIKDSEGDVIRTIELDAQEAGERHVEWDGLDSEGVRAPAGSYTVSVTATDASGGDVSAYTFIEGRVSEILYDTEGVFLRIGDAQIQIGDVISIGESDEANGGLQRW